MSCFEEVIINSPNIQYKKDIIEAVYDYHFNKVVVDQGKMIVSVLPLFN